MGEVRLGPVKDGPGNWVMNLYFKRLREFFLWFAFLSELTDALENSEYFKEPAFSSPGKFPHVSSQIAQPHLSSSLKILICNLPRSKGSGHTYSESWDLRTQVLIGWKDRPPSHLLHSCTLGFAISTNKQKYLGIMGCLFSVYILFGEETLSLPMISINNLKSQKAESRTDGPQKGKGEHSSPRGSNLPGREAAWEAPYHFHMVPDTFQPFLSLSLCLWGGGKEKEGRATPSCPRNTWKS